MPPPKPHPANAPGDFYVEYGCCITCGIPLEQAPEIFAWTKEGGYSHCIVANQPKTPSSVDRTLMAMFVSDVPCIRYRGRDSDIACRIVEMDLGDQCDEAPPIDAVPLVRSDVSFRMIEGNAPVNAEQIAASFLAYFTRPRQFQDYYHFRKFRSDVRHATVEISWHGEVYHHVTFEKLAEGEWHISTRPGDPDLGIAVSFVVDGWLRDDERFQDIRWFSKEQWRAGGPYRSTVI